MGIRIASLNNLLGSNSPYRYSTKVYAINKCLCASVMLKIIHNLTSAKSQQATRKANFTQQVDFIYLSNARSWAIRR